MSLQRLAVPVEQTWIRELPVEWRDVVSFALEGDSDASERLEKLAACGHEYIWWACPNGHEAYSRRGCRDPLCYPCQRGYTLKRTKEIMGVLDVLYGLFHDKMAGIGVEFTEPVDIQRRMTSEDIEYMRSCAVSLLKVLFGGDLIPSKDRQHVKRRRLMPGGIVVPQWWPSFKECDADGIALRGRPVKVRGNVWKRFEPHIHALVFDRIWDNQASRLTPDGVVPLAGAFEKQSVTFSRKEHESLRLRAAGMWREMMEARFGKSSFNPDGKKGAAGQASSWDVHFEPIVGRHDMEDRIFYMIRGIVQDSYREAVVNKCAPAAEKRPLVRQLLRREKYSNSWVPFGWFAKGSVNHYANTVMGTCSCGHAVHKGECNFEVKRPAAPVRRGAFCGNTSCRHDFHDGVCGVVFGRVVKDKANHSPFERDYYSPGSVLVCDCRSSVEYIASDRADMAGFVQRCHCPGTRAVAPLRQRQKELAKEFCGECGEEMEKRGVVSRQTVLDRHGTVLCYVRGRPLSVVGR